MAGPNGEDVTAGRIASIVTGALEPAERAGGVAYLCVTPSVLRHETTGLVSELVAGEFGAGTSGGATSR